MKTRYFVGLRQIELDNREELLLEYYLVEEGKERGPVFGIEITGRYESKPQHPFTQEYTGPISDDAGLVRRLAEKLCLGTVTPFTLLEQVDQLLGEYV